MLDIHIGGIHCKISLLFPAVLLLLLLTDTNGISAFGFLSAIIHECGHVAALLLFGEKPASLSVSVFGMRMTLPNSCNLSTWRRATVFAAGPFFNMICAGGFCLLRTPTVYAWIHLLLAVINSLPVLPLDGGQLMMTVLRRFFEEETVLRVMRGLHTALSIGLLLLGMAVLQHSGYNFTLLILAVYIGMLGVFCKID